MYFRQKLTRLVIIISSGSIVTPVYTSSHHANSVNKNPTSGQVDRNKLSDKSVPKKPHLVNLSPDPLLSECLLYVIGESETKVGRSPTAGIMLEGEGVLEEHAQFTGTKIHSCHPEAQLYVNGKTVPEGGIELKHGDRLIFGKTHVFRFSTGAGINQARLNRKRTMFYFDNDKLFQL